MSWISLPETDPPTEPGLYWASHAVLEQPIPVGVYWYRGHLRFEENAKLEETGGDFHARVVAIDDTLESAWIELLNLILGDGDLASYMLYEVPSMKGGGSVQEKDGKTWLLRNTDDLRVYLDSLDA